MDEFTTSLAPVLEMSSIWHARRHVPSIAMMSTSRPRSNDTRIDLRAPQFMSAL
jgi:hypothetical protein